jgi:hypothetical protein
MIYCDNETALSETFKKKLPTNNPYDQLAADIDLSTLSRDLISQIPATITISNQWVKGHFKGKRQLSHELNYLVDELAGEFNSTVRPLTPVILFPLHEAELLCRNQQVTSRLQNVIISQCMSTSYVNTS